MRKFEPIIKEVFAFASNPEYANPKNPEIIKNRA